MSTFLILAVVCLIGGFVVTGLAWAFLWVLGVFSPPASLEAILDSYLKHQSTVMLESPVSFQSASRSSSHVFYVKVEGVPFIRNTGAGSAHRAFSIQKARIFPHAAAA